MSVVIDEADFAAVAAFDVMGSAFLTKAAMTSVFHAERPSNTALTLISLQAFVSDVFAVCWVLKLPYSQGFIRRRPGRSQGCGFCARQSSQEKRRHRADNLLAEPRRRTEPSFSLTYPLKPLFQIPGEAPGVLLRHEERQQRFGVEWEPLHIWNLRTRSGDIVRSASHSRKAA